MGPSPSLTGDTACITALVTFLLHFWTVFPEAAVSYSALWAINFHENGHGRLMLFGTDAHAHGVRLYRAEVAEVACCLSTGLTLYRGGGGGVHLFFRVICCFVFHAAPFAGRIDGPCHTLLVLYLCVFCLSVQLLFRLCCPFSILCSSLPSHTCSPTRGSEPPRALLKACRFFLAQRCCYRSRSPNRYLTAGSWQHHGHGPGLISCCVAFVWRRLGADLGGQTLLRLLAPWVYLCHGPLLVAHGDRRTGLYHSSQPDSVQFTCTPACPPHTVVGLHTHGWVFLLHVSRVCRQFSLPDHASVST